MFRPANRATVAWMGWRSGGSEPYDIAMLRPMNRSTHAAAAAIVALALVACGAGTGAGRSTTAYGASFPEEITSANLAEMLRVFHSLPEDEGARPVLRERILTYYARSNGQLGDMDMEALGEHLGAMTDLFSPAELADDPLPQALIPVAEAHLYLLDGALRAGIDYEEILRRGLHELPEDQDLRLAAQLSAQFAGMVERDDLARLQAEYAMGEKVFAHRVGILSQHFGNYYTERGEFAHAVQAYRTSLHYSISAPTNANTAMRLIESQRRNSRYEEAVATVEKVWILYQDAPEFLYLAALCLLEAGHLDKAQNVIERGLSLTPPRPRSWSNWTPSAWACIPARAPAPRDPTPLASRVTVMAATNRRT